MARIPAKASRPAIRSRLLLGASALLAAALPVAAASAGTYNVIDAFGGALLGDAGVPDGNLVMDKSGALYGTTYYGGDPACYNGYGCGTVYKLTPPAKGRPGWTETILYNFEDGADGGFPYTGLLLGANGVLFGGTSQGGYGGGVLFKLTPPAKGRSAWTETTLHDFGAGQDGHQVSAPLVMGPKGELYGTTYEGGTGGCESGSVVVGCGTVFSLTPRAKGGYTYKIIHYFTGQPDGAGPFSYGTGLAVAPTGNALFGTTDYGGNGSCIGSFANGCGTVFALSRKTSSSPWTPLVIHHFTGGATDGESPGGSYVVRDKHGNLYGATYYGGAGNYGIVYMIAPTAGWPLTILHSFTFSGVDGANPFNGLAMGADGTLYGTTLYGGDLLCDSGEGCGSVFKMTHSGATWTTKTLYTFNYAKGFQPYSSVIPGPSGELFGVTAYGANSCTSSSYGCGVVYELKP